MAFSITHPLTIAAPPTTTADPVPSTTPSSTPPPPPPSSTPPPPPPSSTPPPPPPPPPPSQTPTDTDSDTNTNTNGGNVSTPPPTPTVILSTPTTSVMESTSVGTMSDGQAFTTVIQSTTIIQLPATITPPPNAAAANRSSNTGAIVGGVVGGVGGLAIVAFIVWLLLRKRRQNREDQDFDGNFDPARVVSGHRNRLNLDDEGAAAAAAAAVTPYSYQPEMGQHRPSPSVDQYNSHPGLAAAAAGDYSPYHSAHGSPPPGAQLPGVPAGTWHGDTQTGYTSPTSDGGYTSSSHYPSLPANSISTTATGAGMGGAMGAYLGKGPSPGPSEIGSGSASGSGHQGGYGVYPGNGRSAKEREAAQDGRLAVSNFADDGNQGGGFSGAAFPHPQPFQQPYSGAGGSSATSPHPPSFGGLSTGAGAGEKPGLAGAVALATSPVRVHQDAGRVPVAEPDSEEIPPTYDSILDNERR